MCIADYVIPPNQYNSVFVMTNFVRTDQTPSICDEVMNNLQSLVFSFIYI